MVVETHDNDAGLLLKGEKQTIVVLVVFRIESIKIRRQVAASTHLTHVLAQVEIASSWKVITKPVTLYQVLLHFHPAHLRPPICRSSEHEKNISAAYTRTTLSHPTLPFSFRRRGHHPASFFGMMSSV